MRMSKLFLSFTRLLILLRDNAVTDRELASGLYCFDATQSYAMNPWILQRENDVDRVFRENPARGRQVHGKIAVMLVAAQRDGRVVWRGVGENHSVRRIDRMFEENGFPSFDASQETLNVIGDISQWVRDKHVQLEIV